MKPLAFCMLLAAALTAGCGDTDEGAHAGLPIPRVETLAGPIDAGSGGMDVDAAGNVYTADFGETLQGPPGTAVWRITPSGETSVFAQGLAGASGNDFDSEGRLLQSNIGTGEVRRILPDGTVEPYASGLKAPVGIEVVEGDTAYVVNCNTNVVSRISPEGVVSDFAADSLLQCPNGIVRASDRNFYVANFGNGDVVRITPDGTVQPFVTLPGDNNGHILFGNGVLYVVARSANRIYQVTLDGDTLTLAGTGERGLDDGPALQATLSLTNDVALSPDGSVLYFNDVGRGDDGAFVEDDGMTLHPTVVRRLILR